VQGITGIPWYYRQFGYEYALDLGGWRAVGVGQVPKLEDGQTEPFQLRPAHPQDIPALMSIDSAANRRYLVAGRWDEAIWQLELDGRDPESLVAGLVRAIERDGEVVGFVGFPPRVASDGQLAIDRIELAPGVSWIQALPSIL